MKLQNFTTALLLLISLCLPIACYSSSPPVHLTISSEGDTLAVVPINYIAVHNYLFDVMSETIYLQGKIISSQNTVILARTEQVENLLTIQHNHGRIIDIGRRKNTRQVIRVAGYGFLAGVVVMLIQSSS